MSLSNFLLVLLSTALLAAGRTVNHHRAFVELVEDGALYRGKVHVNGASHDLNLQRPDLPVFSRNFRLHEAVADPFGEVSYRDVTPSGGVRALEEEILVDEATHGVFRLRNDSGSIHLTGHMKNMHISHDGEEHFAVIHDYSGKHHYKDYIETNLTLSYNNDNNLRVEGGVTKANPELHIVIDYQLWTDLGKSEEKALEYAAIVVHGANRRYQTFSDPEIRSKIVSATIMKDPSAQTFINIKDISEGQYDMMKTLPRFGAYIHKLDVGKRRKYDIAVLISGESYDWNGLAYRPGGCKGLHVGIDGVATRIYKGVLVATEKKALFTGIHTLAHELAHSLGAPHDGNHDGPDPDWDTGDCPWEDGYIMSYEFNPQNVYKFSKCSQRNMKKFIDSDEGKCLRRDQSKDSWPESSIDPGTIVSLDEHCAGLIPKSECKDVIYSRGEMNTPEKICEELLCECKDTGMVYEMERSPLEGTPCKESGKAVCQEGKCVDI